MITCNFCKHTNPDTNKFCEKCGSTLSQHLSASGTSHSPQVYTGNDDFYYAPKKKKTGLFIGIGAGLTAVIAAVVLLFVFVFNGQDEDTYTKSSKKAKTTTSTTTTTTTASTSASTDPVVNTPDDDVTILIYMIGANLDRSCSAATTDINEMMAANYSDNINVVVEAGGTTYWANDYFTDGEVDRAVIRPGNVSVVEHLGKIPMTISSSLTDFITWGVAHYPAKKYHLVLWDHGGGVVSGFGSDENFPEYDGLYISDIANAIGNSGIYFDLISYNACLMATVENAYALSPYADYMIASEESVYALAGLNYTSYLNTLASDAGQDTLDVAKTICDAFMYHDEVNDATNFDLATISVIDLSEVPALITALSGYFGELRSLIQTGQGSTEVLSALVNSKSYGDAEFDEVDLISFISKISSVSLERTKAVRQAFYHCIAYRPEMIQDGSSGLSIYIPYNIAYSNGHVCSEELINEGITDSNYIDFINEFGNLLYAMNTDSGGSGSESTTTGYEVAEVPMDLFWRSYNSIFNYPDIPSLLNGYALTVADESILLSDCDLGTINNVSSVSKNMYLSTDFGFLADLGSIPRYTLSSDTSKIGVEISTEWYSVNNHPVPYYYKGSTQGTSGVYDIGYSYGVLNNSEDIILVCASDETGYTIAIGYYDNSDNGVLNDFQAGDQINFTYDIYTYAFEGDHIETDYTFTYVVDSSCEIEFVYDYIDDDTDFELLIYYDLEDVYGNKYYTERYTCGTDYEEYADAQSVADISEIISYMEELVTIMDDPDIASEFTTEQYQVYLEKLDAIKEVVDAYKNADWTQFSQKDLEVFSYAICQIYNGVCEMFYELTQEDIGSIDLSMNFFD